MFHPSLVPSPTHLEFATKKKLKHKSSFQTSKFNKSSSISLEEKFEALMKSYQTVSSTNQELKQQNDYMKNSNQELNSKINIYEDNSVRPLK